MKSKRPSPSTAPNELARRYQRSLQEASAPDFDERAYLDIVAHYRERMMAEEALNVAEAGLQHFPFTVELYLAKATVLCDLHIYEDALDTLNAAETYRRGMPEIILQRAKALAGAGKHEEAFGVLDELDELQDPRLRSEMAVAEAVVFERMGRYADMYFFLAQALHEWPTNLEALALLWIGTELTGRHAQTEEICADIVRDHAYCSRAWFNLGHARYAQGNAEEALGAFEYAYIIDPRYEYAYREAGEICYETGQFERAVEIYEVMLEYVNGDNDVLLRLGQCYLHTEAYTQARLCLNRVLTRTPEHDEALYYRGLCYAAEQRWVPAIKSYRAAIRVNRRMERYAFSMAEAMVQIGDTDGAEAAFALSCEVAPEESGYWLAHVAFLIDLDRGMEAFMILDEAELYTYGPELRYARVAVFMLLGREGEALRLLAEILPEEWEERGSLFEIAPNLADHDLVLQVIKCFS